MFSQEITTCPLTSLPTSHHFQQLIPFFVHLHFILAREKLVEKKKRDNRSAKSRAIKCRKHTLFYVCPLQNTSCLDLFKLSAANFCLFLHISTCTDLFILSFFYSRCNIIAELAEQGGWLLYPLEGGSTYSLQWFQSSMTSYNKTMQLQWTL